MTLTTEVRINWPVSAERLLDHVTTIAGGDPANVRRRGHTAGSHTDTEWHFPVMTDYVYTNNMLANLAGQGLRTLAGVTWSETQDVGYEDRPKPPALVVLSIDNPYGYMPETGRWVQANEILPEVVKWLDAEGVPRDHWWWEDETACTFHPGTEDVAKLDTDEPRETWTAQTGRSQ